MTVNVETLTPAEQRLLGHLIVLTHRVPSAHGPRFVYHAHGRDFGKLRHPVMLSLQMPVDLTTLKGLYERGLVGVGVDQNDQRLMWLTPLGLDMRDPLRDALRPDTAAVS